MSIGSFHFAFAEDGPLTPLQRLLWARACDTGMNQEARMRLLDVCEWAGAPLGEVKEAFAYLYDTGRLENLQFSGDGTVWFRTRFADELLARNQTTRSYSKAKISSSLRQQVMEDGNHECAYCGVRDVPLGCDHVIPESRGGPTELDNLVPACRPCNSSKGTKTPEEWEEWKVQNNGAV